MEEQDRRHVLFSSRFRFQSVLELLTFSKKSKTTLARGPSLWTQAAAGQTTRIVNSPLSSERSRSLGNNLRMQMSPPTGEKQILPRAAPPLMLHDFVRTSLDFTRRVGARARVHSEFIPVRISAKQNCCNLRARQTPAGLRSAKITAAVLT